MISAPTNWNTLWGAHGTQLELSFAMGGRTYTNQAIGLGAVKLTHSLYDSYSIGNACAAKLALTLKGKIPLPEGAERASLACRLTSESTTSSTPWVAQGTYYLDTAEYTTDGDTKLVLYDGLALCDCYLYTGGVVPAGEVYPQKASAVVRAICDSVGLILDTTNESKWSQVTCSSPDGMTCRQILQSIAACAGGNWTMTKAGKLKFVPLASLATALQSGVSATVGSMTETSTRKQVSGVSLTNGSSSYERGGNAFKLEATTEYASDDEAQRAYNAVRACEYQGFKLQGVNTTPLLELGDLIAVVGSAQKVLADSVSLTYIQGLWGDITSPLRDEVERRLSVQNQLESRLRRIASYASYAQVIEERIDSEGYVEEMIARLNAAANETGGWTYIVPGSGIRTYDTEVSDPSVGAEATMVVEVKGGTIRIASSRDAQGDWDWKTVFTSGHIAANMVTAANITTGFIGSPSGDFWDLDAGRLRMTGGATYVDSDGVQIAFSDIVADAQNGAQKRFGATNLLNGTKELSVSDTSGLWDKSSWAVSGNVSVEDMDTPNSNLNRGWKTYASWSARQDKVPVSIGEDYVLSVYAKGSGALALGVCKPSDNKPELVSVPDGIMSNWNHYYLRVSATDKNTENGFISVVVKGVTGQQIAGMQLERGTAASDWSPSPEDEKKQSTDLSQDALNKASQFAKEKADEALSKSVAHTNEAVKKEGTNVRALLDEKIEAIAEREKQYTADQKKALEEELTQAKIFKKLFPPDRPQGVILDGGRAYINASYIQSGVLNAGIVRTGILGDVAGKNIWNLATGFIRNKNAELVNCEVKGTLESGTSNVVQFNEGTIRFYNGRKNALTIDGALRFADGNYGAHITFQKYLVLRGPKLATTTDTTSNGKIGFTGRVRINITYGMNQNMSGCKNGYIELKFINGMFMGVGANTSGVMSLKEGERWA